MAERPVAYENQVHPEYNGPYAIITEQPNQIIPFIDSYHDAVKTARSLVAHYGKVILAPEGHMIERMIDPAQYY